MARRQSKHSWLCAFSERVIEVRPSLNALAAVQHAVESYRYASDLPAHSAADLFLELHFMAQDVGHGAHRPATQRAPTRPAADFGFNEGAIAA